MTLIKNINKIVKKKIKKNKTEQNVYSERW